MTRIVSFGRSAAPRTRVGSVVSRIRKMSAKRKSAESTSIGTTSPSPTTTPHAARSPSRTPGSPGRRRRTQASEQHERDEREGERRADEHVPPERGDPARGPAVRVERVLLRPAARERERDNRQCYEPCARQPIPDGPPVAPATRRESPYSSGSPSSSARTSRPSTGRFATHMVQHLLHRRPRPAPDRARACGLPPVAHPLFALPLWAPASSSGT